LDQYGDRVDQSAEEIGAFFDHLRLVGVRGLVSEQLNDADYLHKQKHPKAVEKPSAKPRG
jgi:hypothetical protein